MSEEFKEIDYRRDDYEFPKIAFNPDHDVLFRIGDINNQNGQLRPYESKSVLPWDNKNVRMPFSKHNTYDGIKDGKTEKISRWKNLESILGKPIKNFQELKDSILEYNYIYRKTWTFTGLEKFFDGYMKKEECETFFKTTLPAMQKLALELPKLIRCPLPLLMKHQNKSISLSQLQIASLLANAFFCTFPMRNATDGNNTSSELPNINFNTLYEGGSDTVFEKLKCIIHYFSRVCSKKGLIGAVTFTRRYVDNKTCPNWSTSNTQISSIPITVNENGSIEVEGAGELQVNFAHKFVGGATLKTACAQQETRFLACPELIVSMLFTEMLDDNESLLMIGCERYSKCSGYSNTFKWSGNYDDKTPRDSSRRLKCAIISIDALDFKNLSSNQYELKNIDRELNKAWIGFSVSTTSKKSFEHFPAVATGNWGCGAYKGSPDLKFLIQLMACCEAHRSMTYYTFKNTEQKTIFLDIYTKLTSTSIATLYGFLRDFKNNDGQENQLFSKLKEFLEKQSP